MWSSAAVGKLLEGLMCVQKCPSVLLTFSQLEDVKPFSSDL